MQPDDQTRLDQALARHRAGAPMEALPVYLDLQKAYPDDDNVAHLIAVVFFQTGKLDDALGWAELAVGLAPHVPNYRNTLGAVATGLGRLDVAAAAFEPLVAADAGNLDAAFNLGNVRLAQARTEDAVRLFERVVAAAPDNVEALNNLGAALKTIDRRQDAARHLRRAVELQPGYADALINLADTLERLNLNEEAAPIVERLLTALPNSALVHILAARLARRVKDHARAADLLGRAAALAKTADDRSRALFELGKVRDLMDEPTAAFQAFDEANRLAAADAARLGIGSEAFLDEVRRTRAWFTPARLAETSLPLKADPARRPPVFLVGFPRSGTTLIERMMDAHPALVTTGERSPLQAVKAALLDGPGLAANLGGATPADVAAWREMFWDAARRVCGPALDERRLVDKMPLNIVDIGLIQMLCPNARIVVSLRDPRDVALSCFMQQFRKTPAMITFSDLGKTATLYDAVMGLWLEAREATRLPWLEYRYEDLVADYQRVLGDILSFIDEPWADDVTAYRERSVGRDISTPSYENVTEPLYAKSIGRWRKYEEFLRPHLAVLRPYVEAFGYAP